MTKYTELPEVSTDDTWSAANHNLYIRDNFATLRGSFALVTRDAVQSIPNDTLTTITMDHEYYDTGDYYSAGAPTRITFPVTGFYLVIADVNFGINTTGVRCIYGFIDGVEGYRMRTNPVAATGYSTAYTTINFPILTYQTPGKYLEFKVDQTSTGALNVTFFRVGVKLLHDLTT